jgi:REP element-mobilizing transposase RayT
MMPSPRINKELNDKMYFLTFTVKNWYYLFDRHNRWEILKNSLQYCQKHKNLKIYHYVFMLNHIHVIISSPDVAGFIRDFKRFTSREFHKNLAEKEPSVLEIFKDENDKYRFWKKTNMPILLETEKVYQQKAQYIEFNPVRKLYVSNPEHWIYSSANPKTSIKLDKLY